MYGPLSICYFYSLITNVSAQPTFTSKCVCLVDCVRLLFARATWFYSISAFYLLVRKNLFTFRIPVSSERWPVLIYQLSSPSCPLALSPPPPSSNQFNILHILNLRNSPTPLRPHTPRWTSSCNSWRHRLSIKGMRPRFFLLSATTPSNNGGNRVMLFALASCTSSGTGLALLEVKRVHSVPSHPARFWVLLGGEFLHGLDTRWKLSWRNELAGSFPVRRPGVNQSLSQRERPYSLTSSSFFFFLTTPLLLHPLI